MIAAARHFIYRGGGPDFVPRDATHVTMDESITVIPELLFHEHSNIVELICHAGVKKIEATAFRDCPNLKRVIIPGVEAVESGVFDDCKAVAHVECQKLEIIDPGAFFRCKPLSSINLPSAKVVGGWALESCSSLIDVKFGENLESIENTAFFGCPSLERITIPLKNGLFTRDDIFQGCDNLRHIDLVEGEELHDTIDALLLEEWRNDMNEQVFSINQILSNANAGYIDFYSRVGEEGDKTRVIREWIRHVLRKIIYYKAEHRLLLNEAASTLQLALPNDIVTNSVMSFLELPSYTFDGEGLNEDSDIDSDDSDDNSTE